jgi:hypothetical protein
MNGREAPDSVATPPKDAAIPSSVVSTALTSTTNITGFRHIDRGSSFRIAPGIPATN